MPALFIDSCSQLKSILEKSESLPPHYWLVSYLECYDTSGWDGCEKWGKCSFILTDEELKKDIQRYVKERTAPYKYPRIVEFRDSLPKTVSGKIQRNKL